MATANIKTKTNMSAKQRRLEKSKKPMDVTFFILILVLLTFGLIMLFSASFANALYYENDSFYYISRQAQFAALGIVAMLIISKINYHIYKRFAYPIFFLAVILLIIVLIIPTNDPNGIKRWISIPGVGQFQPSEIMKFAIIVIFGMLISKNYSKMGTFTYGVMPFLIFLGVVAVLMLMEPHLSGTILILGIGLVMMFVGGTKYRYFGIAIGLAVVGVITLILLLGTKYFQDRLTGWLDPFSDIRNKTHQTYQSLLTIGSGGFMGTGLGHSKQKFLFLPEPQNDFIFAIVCEELGFIGATVVILLFAMFVYRGFVIASKAPDKFGMMLAVGITAQIGIQALLNIAVVTNSIPNTGISLPFFSYGGTSLLMLLGEIGIVLNISRHASIEKEE